MMLIKTLHLKILRDRKAWLPERIWESFSLQSLIVIVVLFLANASTVNADMVFDFQKKMADKGNVEAQFKVGEMYEMGRGVKKNSTVAVEWFNKAAAKGHVEAGYKLLYLDIKKNGVNADNKNAFENLKSKGKSDEGNAQYFLGLMYHHGVGLKRSEKKAMEWYKKAALQGVTAAEQGIESIETARGKRAASKAKRKADKKKKAEADKRSDAKKKAELAKKNRIAKDKSALEKAKKAKAAKSLKASEAKENEFKRKALIKARLEREQQEKAKEAAKSKKVEFEADPCSGKSARFLSTCR